MLEVIIVAAIISVVSTFAVMGVSRARSSIRLQNSMRLLAGNVEKARVDAIRRHSSARVEFTNNKTYTLTMDFDGTGNDDATRAYSLEGNVTITNPNGTAIADADLPVIDFDWRGRTTQCFTLITMRNTNAESSTLGVSSTGDVTVNSTLGATVTTGAYATVSPTTDVSSGSTIAGGAAAAAINPCGGVIAPVVPPGSTPPPGCGVFKPNVSSVTIRKNGGSTDGFVVTTTTMADTIKVIQTDGRTIRGIYETASSKEVSDPNEDLRYRLVQTASDSYIERLDVNTGARTTVLANRVDSFRVYYFPDKVDYTPGSCVIDTTATPVTNKKDAKYLVLVVCVNLSARGTMGSEGYQPQSSVQLISDVALRNADFSTSRPSTLCTRRASISI